MTALALPCHLQDFGCIIQHEFQVSRKVKKTERRKEKRIAEKGKNGDGRDNREDADGAENFFSGVFEVCFEFG